MQEHAIIGCAHCGAKNRVPKDRLGDRPVCGRCSRSLAISWSYPEHPVPVSDQTLAKEVLQFPGPVVLYIYSPGCPYCQRMNPIFDQLTSEYAGKIKFTKLLMEQNPQTSSQYQVDGVPTLLLFRQGKLVNRVQGLQPREDIRRHLQAIA
jgi:thioredoxin 2